MREIILKEQEFVSSEIFLNLYFLYKGALKNWWEMELWVYFGVFYLGVNIALPHLKIELTYFSYPSVLIHMCV